MEYHVSTEGSDTNDGTAGTPLETISAAARKARPGDVITVHGGIYRERVDPPRGGDSPQDRIVYRVADGETATIRGSEVVTGWSETGDGVWAVTLPNEFFGEFNPFDDRIRGDWFDDQGRDHHRGDVYVNGTSLREARSHSDLLERDEDGHAWHAEVDDAETTIRARFGGADPTRETIEVNVRRAVFYPSEPGKDYITVRGFIMQHAATQWAPPTVEQIGLLGTHWSTGWTIEDNVVSHSRCTGITLGKYGASVDDTGASASRYNDTIREALDNGWEKGTVGGHVLQNNTVFRCEQAGIAGSMGGAFSEIVDNHVYDINVEAQFGGAEIAGLKLHGPIDTEIRHNRIHDARRGVWMDWMTQGTRITGNLLYDNDVEDIFVEVNHGPFVVDNNVSLSEKSVSNWSQGGAYVHNLLAGRIHQEPVLERTTPYHEPHATDVRGMSNVEGGDDRFYNNVFSSRSHIHYERATHPVRHGGNVYLQTPGEVDPFDTSDIDPSVELIEADDRVRLRATEAWSGEGRDPVTTDRLGNATVPDLPYESPDGEPLVIEEDYFGVPRGSTTFVAGPLPGDALEGTESAAIDVEVWPT